MASLVDDSRSMIAERAGTTDADEALGWAEPPTGSSSSRWINGDGASLFLPVDGWVFANPTIQAYCITTLGELRTLLRLAGENP